MLSIFRDFLLSRKKKHSTAFFGLSVQTPIRMKERKTVLYKECCFFPLLSKHAWLIVK